MITVSSTLAEQPSEAPITSFQRIIVPRSAMEHWRPKGNSKYIPIPQSEFNALLASVQVNNSSAILPRCILTEAEYVGQVDANATARGRGRWKFQLRGSGVASYILQGLGISISNPRWADEPGSPVTLGNTPDGPAVILIDHSGVIEFDWSLFGQHVGENGFSLLFNVPEQALSTIELQPPPLWVITSQNALCEHYLAEADSNPNERRWHVNATTNSPPLLLLHPPGAANTATGPLVRQTVDYHLSMGEMKVEAAFIIDSLTASPSSMSFSIDSSLRLIDVSCNDTPCEWKIRGETPQVLDVTLPSIFRGSSFVLRLRCAAPLQVGELVALPQVRSTSSSWQEGFINIHVLKPLTLVRSLPHGCEQLPFQRDSEYRYVMFNNVADVSVSVQPKMHSIQLERGSVVTVRQDAIELQTLLELKSDEDDLFSFAAKVRKDWEVDRVEVHSPDGKIIDWHIERHGIGGSANKRLVVMFTSPVSSQETVYLKINAHRQISTEENFHLGSLEALSLPRIQLHHDVMALRSEGDLRIIRETTIDSSEKVLDEIDPEILLSLAPTNSDMLIDKLAQSKVIWFSVERRPAVVDVRINTEADLSESELTERIHFLCSPRNSTIDHIDVVLPHLDDSNIQWRFIGSSEELLAAMRSSDVNNDPGMQGWRISLPRPTADPFEVLAISSRPIHSQIMLCLPVVRGADTETAKVHISALNRSDFRIRHSGSVSLYTSLLDTERRTSDSIAILSYDANALSRGAKGSIVLVRANHSMSDALIYDAVLDITWTDSSIVRVFRCILENRGRRQIRLALPGAMALRGYSIDQGLLVRPLNNKAPHIIELPSGKRWVNLMIVYSQDYSPMRYIQSVETGFPWFDIPVANSKAQITLPGQFVAIRKNGSIPSSLGSELATRWFGPFLRADSHNKIAATPLESPFAGEKSNAIYTTFEALLRTLGACIDPTQLAELPTWKSVLQDWQTRLELSTTLRGYKIFISPVAMATVGIQPSTSLHHLPEKSEYTDGRMLLSRLGLILVLSQDSVILTTPQEIADHRYLLRLTGAFPVFIIIDHQANLLDPSARENVSVDKHYVDIANWDAVSSVPTVPWQSTRLGFSPTSLESLSENIIPSQLVPFSGQIWLVRKSFIEVIAWFSGLLTLISAYFTMTARRKLSLAILACLLFSATILPFELWPIGAAALLGWLSGMLVRGAMWSAESHVRRRSRPEYAVVQKASSIVPMFLLPMLFTGSASAWQADAKEPHMVIIATD